MKKVGRKEGGGRRKGKESERQGRQNRRRTGGKNEGLRR